MSTRTIYFCLDILMVTWLFTSCARRLETIPSAAPSPMTEEQEEDRPQVCDCVCEDGSAYTQINRGQRVSQW